MLANIQGIGSVQIAKSVGSKAASESQFDLQNGRCGRDGRDDGPSPRRTTMSLNEVRIGSLSPRRALHPHRLPPKFVAILLTCLGPDN